MIDHNEARSVSRRTLLAAAAAAPLAPALMSAEAHASGRLTHVGPRVEPEIRGFTRPGYEGVRDTFVQHAALMGDGGAAFAATVKGELVVDLWGGMAGADRAWSRNTRVHIQSTSKAVTAMAAMILVDRGELDLDAKVSSYWPEYGVNGKENTTVRMLLSHAAGSVVLPGYNELLDLDGNGFDQYDEIASRLAAAEPVWDPGTAHGYHGYTYGNLVSEVVYRITGRRAGGFLAEEYFGPRNMNIFLGTPYSEQVDLASIKPWPNAPLHPAAEAFMAQMAEMETPEAAALGMVPGNWKFDAGFRGLLGGANMDSFSMAVGQLWSQPKALAAEFGAANATADARSLARMYTPLAMDGELDGRQLFTPNTIREFSEPTPPGGPDQLLGMDMRWTPGSHHGNRSFVPGLPPVYGPNNKAFGMSGGGGNYGFADQQNGISCGFVRNHYTSTMALSSLLVESLYR